MLPSHLLRCTYSVAPGMRLSLSLNDVPFSPNPVAGSYSKMVTINQRLLEGQNELRADLETTGGEPLRKACDDQGVARFAIRLERPRDDDPNTYDMVLSFELNGGFDGVDPAHQRYPLSIRLPFDPHLPVRPPSYAVAEPVDDVPCEGTPDLRAAANAYYDHLVNKDRAALIELTEPFMTDLERAYPGIANASRTSQIAELDEMLAENAVFSPLEPEQLHYEARAGGRVISVSRLDGQPVLRARSRDDSAGFQAGLLLVKTGDGWRVM